MAAQHERVAAGVSRARAVLPGWRDSPGGPEPPTAIDEILAALGPHLDEEQARILPLCRQHITQQEWQVTGDAAFASFTNQEKSLALGWMVSTATPEEAADFVGRLPLFVRALWALVGSRRFTRRMQQLRGQRRRADEPAVR